MDIQLIRPLSSNIVHIRSKDANQLSSGYNSHFKFILEDPIKINQGEQINITMSSGEFPYSFYNISSDVANNTIVYDTSSTYTIPDGNYSIYDLRDDITDNMPNFTATFDLKTMKLTLTNTDSSPHTINWTSSTATKMMGFADGDDVVSASGTTTSDYVINMCSVHSLMIRSNLATGNVQSTTHSNSTILQKVSIDTNGFQMVYLNQDDYRTTNITQQPQIDEIELKITDQNNNLIQFNNVNFELSLIFQVFEKITDTRHGQGANDRKNIRRRAQMKLGKPIVEQGISPYTPPAGQQQGEIVETAPTYDDTHPVVNMSEIEDKAQHTILNQLLDLQT